MMSPTDVWIILITYSKQLSETFRAVGLLIAAKQVKKADYTAQYSIPPADPV